MKLRQIKLLLYGLAVAAVLSAVLLAYLVNSDIALLLAIVPLAAFVAISLKLWRCPHCGAYLGRFDEKREFCQHCGKKLDGLK